MTKKAQAISIDLLLALFIFMIIMLGFFYFVSNMQKSKIPGIVKQDSEYIVKMVEQNVSGASFLEGNKVKVLKLYNLTGKSYTELKGEMGIVNDFCIYFVDEEGYVVKINNKTGLGSPRFLINNTPCGT